MGAALTCLLCESTDAEQIETLQVSDLVELYRSALAGIDVASEFGETRTLGFFRCRRCELLFFSPAVAGSERFYEALQTFEWYYLADKAEYRLAAALVPDGATVLDVGCGDGAFARQVPRANYVGLELSKAARDAASRKGAKVLTETLQTHAAKHQASYDIVCAFQVLEHVAGLRSFVESSIECTREGGLLIFSVPAADSFAGRVPNYALNLPPHHVSWWTDECLRRLAPTFGLELVALETEPLDVHHRRLWLHTSLMSMVRKRNGNNRKLVDLSLSHRFVSRLVSAAARMLAPGLQLRGGGPRGHSVTVVYRKTRRP